MSDAQEIKIIETRDDRLEKLDGLCKCVVRAFYEPIHIVLTEYIIRLRCVSVKELTKKLCKFLVFIYHFHLKKCEM